MTNRPGLEGLLQWLQHPDRPPHDVLPRWWRPVIGATFRIARAEGCSPGRAAGCALLTLAVLHAQREGSTAVRLEEVAERLRGLEDAFPEEGAPTEAAIAPLEVAVALVRGVLSDVLQDSVGGSSPGAEPLRAVLAVLRSEPLPAVPPLVLRPGEHGGWLLQSERLWRVERRLAELLMIRAMAPSRRGVEASTWADPPGGTPLHALQRLAVERAVRHPLVVVSGGPGTGKTTVVATLLRAWLLAARSRGEPLEAAAERIALAAPTGKAADRMRESLREQLEPLRAEHEDVQALIGPAGPRPLTLHRLLGYSPARDRFRHGRGRPLPHALVVLDEASMLDAEMALALLDALDSESHLVLLGDAAQLPAVGLGAVLWDLRAAAGREGPLEEVFVSLTENYRVQRGGGGASLLRFAERVASGARPTASSEEVVRVVPGQAPSPCGVELCEVDDREGRHAALGAWFDAVVAGSLRSEGCHPGEGRRPGRPPWAREEAEAIRYLGGLARWRVLAAVRRGPGSVEEANRVLGARHAELLGRRGEGESWMEGVPALVSRNDYALGLYNGDLGAVLLSEGGGRAHYRFVLQRGGELRSWPLAQVRDLLRPAWALTVHKAQGSEFDHVALLLPDRLVAPLGRELLYTAVTRARRHVWLVGSLEVLEGAAGRAEQRRTGLGQALREAAVRRMGE